MDNAKQEYQKIIKEINEVIPLIGVREGCSGWGERTYLLAFLIYYFNCKTTLDLGVFIGGSLFTQATIHNRYTNGLVYGVDPYSRETMEQHDDVSEEYLAHQEKYMNEMDFEELYQHVLNQIVNFKYEKNITFLRQPSNKAINFFIENNVMFDLAFIDGNHDKDPVMQDVIDYMPRLNDNGFFVMDDIHWTTIQPAYNYTKTKLTLIYEGVGFGIFQKTDKDATELINMLKEITKI